jgi:outer membrane protein assembly factor BamB
VRDLDGDKVLAKTLDNIFFQRATVFIGDADMRNYTMEADVRSDGNRRTMSIVGLINQRYVISLVGNSQEMEVSSNQERIRVTAPFRWTAGTWYHLKTRVDVASDGSGVVRAKAWKRGEAEPDAWTIEAPHRHAHTTGSPGLFGFSPQSLFRVYVDNIAVTPNEPGSARRAATGTTGGGRQ